MNYEGDFGVIESALMELRGVIAEQLITFGFIFRFVVSLFQFLFHFL